MIGFPTTDHDVIKIATRARAAVGHKDVLPKVILPASGSVQASSYGQHCIREQHMRQFDYVGVALTWLWNLFTKTALEATEGKDADCNDPP